MKIKLNMQFRNFDGTTIIDPENKPATMRSILLDYLGMHQSQNGEELIAAMTLGQKIYGCKEETIKLDDTEKDILLKATKQPKHVAKVYGQMMQQLTESKENPKEGQG